MAARTFRARLGGDSGDSPAVEIPFDVKAAYGSARAKVKVMVNGVTLRTTVAAYRGKCYVGFRRDSREAMGIEIGQTIAVAIEPDTEPRVVEVPEDLRRALSKNAVARRRFEALAPSHRKEHAQWVAEAKKDETRARRVLRVIEMLTARV